VRDDAIISAPLVQNIHQVEMIRHFPVFAIVAASTLGVAPVRADGVAQAQGSAAILENPLAAHSLKEFTATRDRPLFTPSRRPPALPTAVRDVPAPPPPPNLTLFGILIGTDGPSAIVRGAPSEKVVRVRVGDQVDGWKIARIGERQILLSRDDRSVTFTMFTTSHAAEEHTGDVSPRATEARVELRVRRVK
jgi:general secretion pathway protein N